MISLRKRAASKDGQEENRADDASDDDEEQLHGSPFVVSSVRCSSDPWDRDPWDVTGP
jgi:hypothetical protein